MRGTAQRTPGIGTYTVDHMQGGQNPVESALKMRLLENGVLERVAGFRVVTVQEQRVGKRSRSSVCHSSNHQSPHRFTSAHPSFPSFSFRCFPYPKSCTFIVSADSFAFGFYIQAHPLNLFPFAKSVFKKSKIIRQAIGYRKRHQQTLNPRTPQ